MREIRIILPNIRSTHNVGSIMRSADCFGVSHIYFCGYTPYPKIDNDPRLPHEYNKITAQISKTALGAENFLKFSIENDISKLCNELRNDGFKIVAIEQGSKSIELKDYQPSEKIAIIMGNEIDGIDNEIIQLTDVMLEIPLSGSKESLNVSSTCAIVLYILRYSPYD